MISCKSSRFHAVRFPEVGHHDFITVCDFMVHEKQIITSPKDFTQYDMDDHSTPRYKEIATPDGNHTVTTPLLSHMHGRRSRTLAHAVIWHQGYSARHMRDACTVEPSLPHTIAAHAT